MKSLIVAEKASVGRDIAKSLHLNHSQNGYIEGNNYTVTWARGHLMELKPMDKYKPELKKWALDPLPFWPKQFEYNVIRGAGKEYKTIKSLIKSGNFDQIILATDNDREGQLIGETIFQSIGTGNLPVKRLLQDDWRESTVRKGLNNLIDNSDMKGLSNAGYCRQHMDWIIGINLTRAATVKYGNGKVINVGRIILPTLKFVYDRDEEIKNFKPETYYKLIGTFKAENGQYEGTYDTKEKIKDEKKLADIKKAIDGKEGVVKEKEVKEQKKWAEPLFNQAALQVYMTKKYNNWTSSKVLKVSQSLYEKKVQTYPRTESRYLSESSESDVKSILQKIGNNPRITFSKRPFNDKKVDSHGAIIPTGETRSDLTKDEELLLQVVTNRFFEQFMPPAVYEKTKIVTSVDHIDFVTTGTVQKDPGWEEIEGSNSKDKLLPDVKQGETVEQAKPMQVKSFQTTPPSPMTESELIRMMENCGKKYKTEDEETEAVLSGFSIGTGATRDQAIEKIIRVGYVERKKKQLHTTPFGKSFVELFPAKRMFDASFTGKIEYSLKKVEKGKLEPGAFMESVQNYTKESVDAVKESETQLKPDESLGECPLCGGDVVERNKVFKCVNDDFVVYKYPGIFKYFGKSVTKSIIRQALKNEDHKIKLKYEKDKHGKSGTTELVLLPPTDSDFADWDFANKNEEKSESVLTDYTCPKCGKQIRDMGTWYSCSGYPDCKFSFSKVICKHTLTEEEIRQLVVDHETHIINDFVSKKGSTFAAKLVVQGDKVAFDFSKS